MEAGPLEVVGLLRVMAALPEDPGWVPGTALGVCDSSSRGCNTETLSSDFPWSPAHV